MALCLVSAPSSAKQTTAVEHWAKIDTATGFRGWREQLQHMADQDKRFPVSHFCVVVASGPAAPPDRMFTWAYVNWREAALLYTFAPSDAPLSDLTTFKAPLDSHKDVVPSERDIKGSTYRVTRAWVRNVERHCASSGIQVVIRRSR